MKICLLYDYIYKIYHRFYTIAKLNWHFFTTWMQPKQIVIHMSRHSKF